MTIQRIKLRRGTAAAWTSTNPTLAAGEPGYETDTGKHKIGNGATAWASLAYVVPTAAALAADSAFTSQFAPTVQSTLTSRNTARLGPVAATTWISNFQSGHGWSTYGGSQHAAHDFNDTSASFLGPQSISITTTGAGGSGAYIEKGSLTLDFTGEQLVLPIRLSDWEAMSAIVVYLGTSGTGFSNAYQWTVSQSGVSGKRGYFDTDQWVTLTLSFSDAIVIGSPDRADVRTEGVQVVALQLTLK